MNTHTQDTHTIMHMNTHTHKFWSETFWEEIELNENFFREYNGTVLK